MKKVSLISACALAALAVSCSFSANDGPDASPGASPSPIAWPNTTPSPVPAFSPAATPTPGAAGIRPAGNTGTGFFVSGTKLYDANNAEFRIQGVNVNHWWNTGSENIEAVPYVKASGANAARLVFGPVEDPANPDWYVCSTTERRRAAVEEYIEYKIVPIVEYHNATGLNDPEHIDDAADFWIGESWVKDYERYVIVNISNEWGSTYEDGEGVQGSLENWRDTYLAAIAKLRAAGVNNTLIIDSINWASEISVIQQYGAQLLAADPQHNILFSLHMYGGWRAPGDPNDDGNFYMNVDTGLDTLIDLGLPVIVGEFSHECSSTGSYADPEAAEDYQLLDAFNARGTGWIFWMWYNSTGNHENMVYQSASLNYRSLARTVLAYLDGAKEATSFPADPVPTLPTPPPEASPDPNWNPGPLEITVFDVSENPPNPWWLQIEMQNDSSVTGEIDSAELEVAGFEERIRLDLWGAADPYNFRANVSLARYIGLVSRFWLHGTDGSVAKTAANTLVQGNVFAIDTSH